MADQKPTEPQPMPQADGDPATGEGAPTPEQLAQAALAEASIHHPFGPAFFMSQLRGFAGEKCPNPDVSRPLVEIHLANGEALELCYIIGVTPQWVALAVLDGDEDDTKRLRTEFVPYETIARVTLRTSRPGAQPLGFEASRVPRMIPATPRPEMTPEESIRAAAAGSSEPRGD